MNLRWPLFSLLTITALASLCAGLALPVTYPMPGYFADIVAWSTSGHISDTFTPLGYPLFLAPAFRIAGLHGIIVLQATLQVAIALISFFLLRELSLSPRWSAFGSLPVALHPDLLLSVVKIWDYSLSTFLFLLLIFLCLRLRHQRPWSLPWFIPIIGAVFAVAVFCRPNYLLLLPLILVTLFNRRPRLTLPTATLSSATCIAIASITFALLGAASHGSAFFPRNGPYNLYAGHNPFSLQSLLTNLNAEPSLTSAYLESHPSDPHSDLYAPALGTYYLRQSLLFARQNPGSEIELLGVKLLTLLRPDTKVHPLPSAAGILEALLALPILLLLAGLLAPGHAPLQIEDRLLLWAEAIYILPFLLTNADPRFRMPLDALLILHFVRMMHRRFLSNSAAL